jgi:molybdate transport system regulatory protein
MKISARNTLRGTVRRIEQGAVNSEITLEIAPAIMVTSIITNDSVKELGLKVGQQAYAVIKASSVMIGVD